MDERRRQELLEYIKIQWADIHHSRNQDWKALLVAAGVFSGLFVVNRDIKGDTTALQIVISATGILACVVGAYIALAHWRIFSSKQKVIAACEQALGIHIQLLENPLSVQGVILLVYFLLAAPLAGWVTWLVLMKHSRHAVALSVTVSASVVLLELFFCWRQQSRLKKFLGSEGVLRLDEVESCAHSNKSIGGGLR